MSAPVRDGGFGTVVIEGYADGVLESVLDITKLVLQMADISPETDFFEVGGTSLAAMQIMWKIEERLGVHLSMADFCDSPDLQAVADLVSDKLADPSDAP